MKHHSNFLPLILKTQLILSTPDTEHSLLLLMVKSIFIGTTPYMGALVPHLVQENNIFTGTRDKNLGVE